MSHETDRKRYLLPKLSPGNYNTLMKFISPELSDPAKFRKHVLDHYFTYGWRAACDAFGVKKSTLYDWRKSYLASGKRPSSLIPKNTRPHHTRTMTTNPKLVEFIKTMRVEFNNLGRAKIKYFLDEFAKKNQLDLYGTTKIGLIIKRRGFTYASGRKKLSRRRKPLTARVKRSPKETSPGYIEMDTLHLWVLGKKHYFITALDVVTKFAWVKLAKGPSSRQANLALGQFTNEYKLSIRVVQTDNGSEFLGAFDDYLATLKIKHEFIYPRSPKVNGFIERFNRTFKEEFLYKHELGICEADFNQKLVNYLIWYNGKRPHQSLKMKSPITYIQEIT